MQKMVFGTVNKIFIAYEKPFLHPDITEVDFLALLIQLTIIVIFKVITLWNPVDEKVVPMEDRWYRKIYSFCKGSKTDMNNNTVFYILDIAVSETDLLLLLWLSSQSKS